MNQIEKCHTKFSIKPIKDEYLLSYKSLTYTVQLVIEILFNKYLSNLEEIVIKFFI